MNYYKLGEKVKKERKKKGYTQAKLAEIMGYSVQHISNVETGKTIMSLECMIKLVNSLEISLDDFFEDYLNFKKNKLVSENVNSLLKKCENQERSTIVKILTLIKSDIEVYIELAEK